MSAKTATATAGGGSGVRGVVAKGVKILAWVSFALAVIGGCLLPGTFIGGIIAGILGFFPAWVAAVTLFIGFVTMAIDIFVDMVPNRLAIWAGIVLPSVAGGVDGSLGQWVRDHSRQVVAAAAPKLTEVMGEAPQVAIALAAVVSALLVARRVVKKGAH